MTGWTEEKLYQKLFSTPLRSTCDLGLLGFGKPVPIAWQGNFGSGRRSRLHVRPIAQPRFWILTSARRAITAFTPGGAATSP